MVGPNWANSPDLIGVNDFTARQIENDNPLASPQEKKQAARIAANVENPMNMQEKDLHSMNDLELGHGANKRVINEIIRRNRERDERALYFDKQTDCSLDENTEASKSSDLYEMCVGCGKSFDEVYREVTGLFGSLCFGCVYYNDDVDESDIGIYEE